MAVYSPMMHAKRNSYAKFQQNQCGFGHPTPPPTPSCIFQFWPGGLKNAISTAYKKIKIVLELCKYAHFVGNEEVGKWYKGTYALKSILHCENTHLL